MKDKSSFRLLIIGFLSGIVFSGLALILLNVSQADQNKKSTLENFPAPIARINKVTSSNTIELLDLNLATFDELIKLPGIGETKARAIIDFREKYGHFEEIAELKYVPGIGHSLFNFIKDLVIINSD